MIYPCRVKSAHNIKFKPRFRLRLQRSDSVTPGSFAIGFAKFSQMPPPCQEQCRYAGTNKSGKRFGLATLV